MVTEILDRPGSVDVTAMEATNGGANGASRVAGAQDGPQDANNGPGDPDEGGPVLAVAAATAAAAAAAAEAAGAAAGMPTARRKSPAQQPAPSPILEQTSDVGLEARMGGDGEGERQRRSSSSSSRVSFSGLGAGERERPVRQPTLEIPRPSAPSEAAARVRGGSSGSRVEATAGGRARGSREERKDDSSVNVSGGRSAADLEAPTASRDSMLTRNGVSALNLSDGGFAPGEEGCGRDEEL